MSAENNVCENNLEASKFEMSPGLGVSAIVGNKRYWVGSLRYLKTHKNTELANQAGVLEQHGHTCVWCADEQEVLGFVSLSDCIKEDAQSVVEQLKQMGKTITMLSGDSMQVAQSVANQVGIDQVIAQVLPGDKAEYVKNLQREGLVLMVGDGINDAPALTQADVSIAIGSGADVSVASADVVILKKLLTPVVEAIALSKRTQATIKQNIVFALIYNTLMVPLVGSLESTSMVRNGTCSVGTLLSLCSSVMLPENVPV